MSVEIIKAREIYAEDGRLWDIFNKTVKGENITQIALPFPVVDISKITSTEALGRVLNKSAEEVLKVIYFESLVVKDTTIKKLKVGSIISKREAEVYKSLDSKLELMEGADGILFLMSMIDYKKELERLTSRLNKKREEYDELISIYDPNEIFVSDMPEGVEEDLYELNKEMNELGSEIADMKYYFNTPFTVKVLTVFPQSIMKYLDKEGMVVCDEIITLYQRVCSKLTRYERMDEVGAPSFIMWCEKRLVQEAIDALLCNGVKGNPITSDGTRPFTSLADVILRNTKLV